MLISKDVEVILGNTTIKYYESKGYFIPRHKNLYGKYQVRKGTKIIVNVNDLPLKSTTRVLRKCDCCGNEEWVEFRVLSNLCKNCSINGENNGMFNDHRFVGNKNSQWKGGKPKCLDCGKQLSNYNNKRCRNCWAIYETKENHPGWNKELTNEERLLNKFGRSTQCPGIGKWKKEVKERDNYICQCCGDINNLIVHHKDSFRDFKELRLDINNGITLCIVCHKQFHHIYGTRHNRKCQIDEFTIKNRSN